MLACRIARPRLHRWGAALALCLAAAPFLPAEDHGLTPEKQSQIEAAVSKFMASTHVPGMSVAVVENGRFEWSEGFGLADIENNVPASEHTLFRLASISKPLTATGAMQLWEQGKLDLDAPVQKYCPAFPEKPWPLTTREVMGHLGGIRFYKSASQDDPEFGNTKHFDNPIQSGLDFFKNDPLLSEPGTEYHYSTQGYTVVGCVMEGASGTKYVDYMRQNVFAPAGMEQTRDDNRLTIIPYRTRFYRKVESGAIENANFLDSSYKIPGGGWLSSAVDIAKFEVAILNDKLIQRKTRDLMWTPLKLRNGSTSLYALGWGNGDHSGIRTVGHTGGQQGTSTAFVIAPSNQTGVVVLTNMEGAEPMDLAIQILTNLVGVTANNHP